MDSYNAQHLAPWYNYRGKILSIVIEKGVISIGANAFSGGFTNLISVSFPEGLSSIGNCAFCNCSNLASVVLPNSLTAIEMGAFKECI